MQLQQSGLVDQQECKSSRSVRRNLSPRAAACLKMLDEFIADQERSTARIFGRVLPPNPTRDKLLRMILIEFAASRILRVSHYVRSCSRIASGPTIRAEINRMAQAGLVAIRSDPLHVRTQLVAPTDKLIQFYESEMADLAERVERLRRHARDLRL